MTKITLYSVPAPGQKINGEGKFLGTVRTHMHKAPLTALASGLVQRLEDKGLDSSLEIFDMQTKGDEEVRYGSMDLEGLRLDKYRVGCSFEEARDTVCESDIVGVNSNFTHSRAIVSDFIIYAKSVNPRSLVVVGGTDATSDPDYYLRKGADVVVRGEGEVTFQRVIESLHGLTDLVDLPNVSLNLGGQLQHNPATFLKDQYDVQSMPPPNLDIVDLSSYTDTGEGKPPLGISGPFISVETSRGCAQACSFCATPITKGRYRFMNPEAVAKHFEYFSNRGVRTLLFQEDNILSRIHRNSRGEYVFPEGREELLEIFDIARNMGFSWEFTNGVEFGQLEREGDIDFELIEKMFWNGKRDGMPVGCYRATVPLENLTDESSRKFRKLKPFDTSKRVIAALAETGIDTLLFNLIIGRPEDDEEVLRLYYERCQDIRSVVTSSGENNQVFFNVYNLSLLPGTVDFRRYNGNLGFDMDVDPEVVTFYLGSVSTEHFSPLEITQARGTLAKILNGEGMIDEFEETNFITSRRFEKLFS